MAAKQPETVRVKFIDENTIEQCHEKTRRVDVLNGSKEIGERKINKSKEEIG